MGGITPPPQDDVLLQSDPPPEVRYALETVTVIVDVASLQGEADAV